MKDIIFLQVNKYHVFEPCVFVSAFDNKSRLQIGFSCVCLVSCSKIRKESAPFRTSLSMNWIFNLFINMK